MDNKWIYGLVDPRDGWVRYVGVTGDPDRRLAAHSASAVRVATSPKAEWLRELASAGLAAELVILEQVLPPRHWRDREREWIEQFQVGGGRLLNNTHGHVRWWNPPREPLAPEQLREFRELLGWSQQALADRLGVSGPTVSLWESGKRGVPDIRDRLARIALEELPMDRRADASRAIHRTEPGKCGSCGQILVGRSPNQRYCSRSCTAKARWAARWNV